MIRNLQLVPKIENQEITMLACFFTDMLVTEFKVREERKMGLDARRLLNIPTSLPECK